MIRRDEIPVYAAQFAATAAYVAALEWLGHASRPDWAWVGPLAGVAIAAAPAVALARRDDDGEPDKKKKATWRTYERRALAGLTVVGSVVAGWQLWHCGARRGQRLGYELARRILEHPYAYTPSTMESEAGGIPGRGEYRRGLR